ncbi:MAG: hypothetical protein JW808_10135 [Victivallales bacterium]|nr:hypothetical protein [Victivallales bacterium]
MYFDNTRVERHIVDIILRLKRAGFETYLVGGAIRDILMQRVPKDYDISTEGTPEQIRDVFGRRSARIIGKRFRLVHYYHGADIIEISTFRRAPLPSDGEVSGDENAYGTAEEDAWRRDFTVNALFYDPSSKRVVDFTGKGIEDTKDHVVRVIGDPMGRLEEDPVRILRALKLVGQYGFKPEPSTAAAISASLPLITQCSHSRLSLELEKIIRRPYSHSIFQAFHDFGLLPYYLPFFSEEWGTPECVYMLELLRERNERILQGSYRDSVSLAIATACLPYIERTLRQDSSEERGWQYFRGIEKVIHKTILKVFAPFHFPKRIVASAVGMIMLQPSMLNMSRKSNNLRNKRYLHARELMTLQNKFKWNDPELEAFWPPMASPQRHPADPGDGQRRIKRKPRRRGNDRPAKDSYGDMVQCGNPEG